MAYIVTFNWDEQNAVPFGTNYTSKPFASKQDAWAYVCRVKERAQLAHVQLHNVFVWTCTKANRRCVWCLRDPRKSGDPWPTW